MISSTYEATAGINNLAVRAVGQFYQFTYQTDSEMQYNEVYPVPIAQSVTIINPL